MGVETIVLPLVAGIQRGDEWAPIFRFSVDMTGKNFVVQFRHSRFDEAVYAAVIDDAHASDPVVDADNRPYIVAHFSKEITADLIDNLVTGELQVDDETWSRFTVPVSGEFTVTSS